MSDKRGVLVASFLSLTEEGQLEKEIDYIVNHITLKSNYIFLLENKNDPTKKIITYNCEKGPQKTFNPRLYTIRVHRKKATNTLYTINALNAAVKIEHNGNTGKDLKINWDQYKDSLLLTSGRKLQIHPIEVVKIFKIEDPPEEN